MTRRHDDFATDRLAGIVESADDAIVSLDVAGLITSWNHGAERMFGYRPSEVIGQPFHILVPEDRRDEETEATQRVIDGQSVAHYESLMLHKSGRAVEVSVAISAIVASDGLVTGLSVIARDLTESNRLRQIARHFEAIVVSSDDAIVSKDLDGTVITWNRAAEQMFGYTAEEIIGRSIRIIIPDDRQSEEDTVLARIRRGEHVDHYETLRRHKDGRLVPISLTVSPLRNADGKVVGASKIARDMTERHRAEQERQRLSALANEASRLKDEFLATLSHELRTPLNAIVGYVGLLRSKRLPAERHDQALDVIGRNLTSLTQIVEDILDISRIVSGDLRLAVEPVDLVPLTHAAIEAARSTAGVKDITLTLNLDPSPGLVSGDPARLQQILWNLLANAVKFTPAGGRVHVALERVDSRVAFTVTDSGVGIAPEFLPHIFERFRQADGSPARRAGGLGLGLALARQLVELQGGEISVASSGIGAGATFRVMFPVRKPGEPVVPVPVTVAPVPAREAPPLPDLRGVRILAVDDDPDALQLVKEIAESTGAVVTTASSGSAALEQLQREPADILVSDLAMPSMTGFDLIAAVRQASEEQVSSVPAIALTAFARSEDRVRSLRSGFQMHVAKPVDPAELMAAVEALVRGERRGARP